MSDHLPIAVIHLDVLHGRTEENRRNILREVEQAALQGSRLILLPEMAVSGYSFADPAMAEVHAEPIMGPTVQGLQAVCVKHAVHCCLGFLEQDPETGLLHNSAVAVGPDGSIAAHHRKLAAERRWATPGNPFTRSWFDTPWGRIGMLVCADSYFSLPARTQALEGVDLLVVLANWPPQGVDPRTIWRVRAQENGIGVIGCNRTGQDLMMDCSQARSFAVDGAGRILLDAAANQTMSYRIDWPLVMGRLDARTRERRLGTRTPRHYRGLGLDANGLPDTTYLWGKTPEHPLNLRFLVPEAHLERAHHQWHQLGRDAPGGARSLALLPPGPLADGMAALPEDLGWVAGARLGHPFLKTPEGLATLTPDEPSRLLVLEGYRLALVRPEALLHPELAVSLAKQGCDLAIVPTPTLDGELRTILGSRCLDRLPVALAAPEAAALLLPPAGHEAWAEVLREEPGLFTVTLDVAPYRRRHFMDRVNLEVLCR